MPAERGRDDDGQHPGAGDVGRDEGAPLAHPVDPGPGRQADEQKGCRLGRREGAHLARRRLEVSDGVHRQGQPGELGTELTEAVADPEPSELRVPGQGSGWCGSGGHLGSTLAERGFLLAQPERKGVRGAREVPYLATRKSWRSPMPQGQDRVLIETFLEGAPRRNRRPWQRLGSACG